MAVKKGRQTILTSLPVSVSCWALSGGKKEGDGPLGKGFDYIYKDSFLGQDSWEKGESMMIENTLGALLKKSALAPSDIELIFSGDLMNQCTSTTYGIRSFDIPSYGIYGACSNIGEAMSLCAMAIETGGISRCCSLTSSHFCTAERQFRYPLEYGGVKTTTAQWTVTASTALLIENKNKPPFIRAFSTGTITDMGIKDITNMGAAMAPDKDRHTS